MFRFLMLTLAVSGCATETPAPSKAPNPLCIGTASTRTDLAAVLAASPDDRAVAIGARLIAIMDAGCRK